MSSMIFMKVISKIICGKNSMIDKIEFKIPKMKKSFKINDMFKPTNKETQIIKQKSVSASKEDKTSLQIDSLNNLYKNKTITLDEFIKGVNKIGRKNK